MAFSPTANTPVDNFGPPEPTNEQAFEGKFPARSVDGAGKPTQFNATAFDFKSTCYPSDLLSEGSPYGNNYMVFYFNVHEDSVLAKTDTLDVNERVAAGLGNSLRDAMAGLDPAGVDRAIKGEVAVAGGGAAVATASRLAGPAGKLRKKLFGKGAAGVTSAAAETALYSGVAVTGAAAALTAVENTMGLSKKAYKTCRQAVALYVPSVATNYSAQWSDADTMFSQAVAQGLTGANWDGTLSNLPSAAAEVAKNVVGTGANYLVAQALGSNATGFMQKSLGVAQNPKKEQLFKSIDFRRHQFQYDFAPRDITEAKAVIEIIKLFKLHMHPEFNPKNQFTYIYPSEFDIFYYSGGTENLFLPRYTSCVIESMLVQYADQSGTFQTFDEIVLNNESLRGMPSHIRMTLHFKELAILTKETIMDGY